MGGENTGAGARRPDSPPDAPPQPFFGRVPELAALRRAWDSCLHENGWIFGIEGEAGVGKSCLVQHFAGAARLPLLMVYGHEDLKLVEWGMTRQIARALPSPGTKELIGDSAIEADPSHVAMSLLADLAGPMVLFVDDAHWADESSLTALRFAMRDLESPVLIVLAYHPGGLGEKWRRVFGSARGTALRLGGLPPADLVRLAAANGREGLSPAGAARVHEHTGGNPLHAGIVFEMVPEVHVINHGAGPLPVPEDIASAVAAKFRRCTERTRAFLAAGAVLGSRFRLADVRAVAGADGTGPPIAEAVAARLLREAPGTGGRELVFVHRLLATAIYHDLPVGLRWELHSRAGKVVSGIAGLLHRVEAAADGYDARLAAEVELEAHRQRAMGRAALATSLLCRALDLTEPGELRDPRLLTAVEALLVSGDALTPGRYEPELAAREGDPWWDYVAGYQSLLAGRIPEAVRRLERAARALRQGPPPPGAPADLETRVLTQLAIIAVVNLADRDMLMYGEAAVRAEAREQWVSAFAWFARVVGLALVGRGAEALTLLSTLDSPGAAAGLDGLVARGMVRLWTDDLDGALRDLADAEARANRGEPLRVGQALGFLSEAEYRRGLLADSADHAEQAVGDAMESRRYWDLPLLYGLACYPRAARGDWTRAEEHCRHANEWAGLVKTRTALLAAAASWATLAQARGEPDALLEAATALESTYPGPHEPGTHLLGPLRAEALALQGRVEEAEEALHAYVERFGASGRRSCEMGIARVRGQIAARLDGKADYRRALEEYARALDLARGIGLRLEAAKIEMLIGRCHATRGEMAAAEQRLRTAISEFDIMGAGAYQAQALKTVKTYGLSATPATGPLAGLDPTMQTIARLARKGLTNKEISAKVWLSEKSIEAKLSAIFRHLGVERRTGLIGKLTEND